VSFLLKLKNFHGLSLKGKGVLEEFDGLPGDPAGPTSDSPCRRVTAVMRPFISTQAPRSIPDSAVGTLTPVRWGFLREICGMDR